MADPYCRFHRSFRHDSRIAALDERLRWAFWCLCSIIHESYPNEGLITPSIVNQWSHERGYKPSRAGRALVCFCEAGLIVPIKEHQGASYKLVSTFMTLSGKASTIRVREYRSRHKTDTARTQPIYPMSDGLLQANDLGEKSNSFLKKKKNKSYRSNLSLVGNSNKISTLNEESAKSGEKTPILAVSCINPDEFDTEVSSPQSIESKERSAVTQEEFALTSPGPNGSNGASLADGVRALFEYWLTLPHLERHRDIYPQEAALKLSIKRWGILNMRIAFERYSEVLSHPSIYWLTYKWSIQDLISTKKGQWVERLISSEYKTHFTKSNRTSQSLDDHYRSLLADKSREPD